MSDEHKIHAMRYDQFPNPDDHGFKVVLACACGWSDIFQISGRETIENSPFQIIVDRYEKHIEP